jgi:hypothetical protein
MTLQVGFVGIDGVVLASDTKWSERQREIRHTFGRRKITINEEQRVAVSAARNMDSSMKAAREIADGIKGNDWMSPELRIQDIALKAIESLPYNVRDVNCLIISPRLRLYRLEMVTDLNISEQAMPMCAEHSDKACAGDTLNNALFWGERYYQRQPICKLIPLAAYLINAGGKLSPDRIGGLEIVICDKKGVHRLPDDSINELQAMAEGLDSSLLTSLSREFSYPQDAL